MMTTFAEKFRALRNCANWNEAQAAEYFKKARKIKNHDFRKECFRNADRHTKTAMRINQTLARV